MEPILQLPGELGRHREEAKQVPSCRLISFPFCSPRCIPCIGAQEPVSKGPRKSSPKASSPTGASRRPPPGPPRQPHRTRSGATSPAWGGGCLLPSSLPLPSSPPPSSFSFVLFSKMHFFFFLEGGRGGSRVQLCDAHSKGEEGWDFSFGQPHTVLMMTL